MALPVSACGSPSKSHLHRSVGGEGRRRFFHFYDMKGNTLFFTMNRGVVGQASGLPLGLLSVETNSDKMPAEAGWKPAPLQLRFALPFRGSTRELLFRGILTLLLAAVFTTGCNKEQPATGRISKIKTETNDALPEFKEYTIAQLTDFRDNIPAGLAVIDNRPDQIVSAEGFSQAAIPPIPQSVTLAWDASPSSNLKCYRIHFGTNRANYAFVTNVGLVLTQTVVLPHRDRWLFAITAVDVNGVESPLSNQTQASD